MPCSSFVRRCKLGLLHTGSFLCQCFGQCSGINHSGRSCEKFQVKLASQVSRCCSTLEVAFLYGGQMHMLWAQSKTRQSYKLPRFHDGTFCKQLLLLFHSELRPPPTRNPHSAEGHLLGMGTQR